MSAVLSAALGYARRGWHVFPVQGIINGSCTCGRSDCSSPGKHPLTRNGLADATTGESVITAWWRTWRRANVAVATGAGSGIVVIDIDLGPRPTALLGSSTQQGRERPPKTEQALDSLLPLAHRLPPTLTGLTGGGGLHLIYRARSRSLRCTSARVPGIARSLPGIDVRAEGGYVVAPPSLHLSGIRYGWLDPDREPALLPDWIRERPRREIPVTPTRVSFTGTGTPYGLAVLRNQLGILSRAKVGERNHTLNRCAFAVGRYVAAGHLLESAARAELTRVGLSMGLTRCETERTINSALSAAFGRIR